MQDRAAVGGFQQVKAADLALVVAVGGDAAGIGGPLEDGRALAVGAAARDLLAAALGDGAVAEVRFAVVGELGFLAAGGVAHPEVLAAGEGDPAAVGRGTLGVGGRGGVGGSGAGVGADVAGPLHGVGDLEADCAGAVHEVELLEGESAALVGGVGGEGQRGRQASVIEGGAAGGGGRIDDDELVAGRRPAAEPEAVAIEELGHHLVAGDQLGGVPGEELLGARVGALADLLSGQRRGAQPWARQWRRARGGQGQVGGRGDKGQCGRGLRNCAKRLRHCDLGLPGVVSCRELRGG